MLSTNMSNLHTMTSTQISTQFSELLLALLTSAGLNRPLSFISLSHSNNQSELATKFYNSFKADGGGIVLTLT